MYLGIDLGTSEIKFLLLDESHRVLATLGEALTVSRQQPLWSEQSPADWWSATDRGLLRMAEQHPEQMACVKAIGLSGQMHGAVVLDANNKVLRPAILWNDGRSSEQCQTLERNVPLQMRITGNLAMPGFTAPKLLWLRDNEPDVFSQITRVLLPKDWLRLQLSGEAISDLSDASGTLWLDVGKRCWSEVMLAATGLTQANMPRLVEGSEVAGHLRPSLAAHWGLPTNVPIAGGAGDNAASAVGMGLVQPGQGFVSLGTSGVIFVTTERFAPNPALGMHAFCHAVPGRWHQMSVMLSAASALNWAVRAFGFADEPALIAAAANLADADRAQAPFFLPYLSGERTPHNNAHASAVMFGMTTAHGPSAIAYAVLEGVSLGLLDGFKTLTLPESSAVTGLSVVGGGSRSSEWVQMLADTLGVPLTTHEASTSGAALGAARLAWLADGGRKADVCQMPAIVQRFVPRPSEYQRLQRRYETFRDLYNTLKKQF